MEHDSLLSKGCYTSQQESAEEVDPTLIPRKEKVTLSIEEIDSPYKDRILSMPQEKRWQPFNLRNYQGFWELEGFLPGIMALQDHFKPRSSDIFIATFPKCGTTWLKAQVFSVINRKKYSFATHPLLRLSPHDCVKFLEQILYDEGLVYLKSLPSPRLFSLHMPYSMLPGSIKSSECKILYVCRNPKDAFVSMWHMAKMLQSEPCIPLSEAFDLFCDGISPKGPIWDHALEYWYESLMRHDKVLFLRYEDMLADPLGTVRKIADFLGYPFTEDEKREGVGEKIVDLCSFRKLTSLEVNKKQEGDSKFVKNHTYFRKGSAGDWNNHLTEKMSQRLDMITKQKLEGSGLVL